MSIFKGKAVCVTGGSGFLGVRLCKYLLKHNARKVIIFSRDWEKQNRMRKMLGEDNRLRFFIGDIRDKDRLILATKNTDIVIHAAAIKCIVACEDNPAEALHTNVIGSQNVLNAAIYNKVNKTLLISSDKAVNPINTYGATKCLAEKLFLNGNKYAASDDIMFGVVRYGNVFGSAGSVYDVWRKELEENKASTILSITHPGMTRFYINIDAAIAAIEDALEGIQQKQVLIPKLNAFLITDLVKAIERVKGFKLDTRIIGIRCGEKLHEELAIGQISNLATRISVETLVGEIRHFERGNFHES